jgi:CRISPR-associated protein Cas6
MLWQEEEQQQKTLTMQTVLEVAYEMTCRCLPVDHAYALSTAIQQALPWFAAEPLAGLHLIHGGESSHGWQRPRDPDSLLYFSRRTKLMLRLPHHRITDAQALSGMTLDVAGYTLQVGKLSERPLVGMSALLARYVVMSPQEEEEDFLQRMVTQLQQMGISCRKALCGKTATFQFPEGELWTRSVMVADLSPQDSVLLQQHGLGPERQRGCGLFVPQKDIKPVKPDG